MKGEKGKERFSRYIAQRVMCSDVEKKPFDHNMFTTEINSPIPQQLTASHPTPPPPSPISDVWPWPTLMIQTVLITQVKNILAPLSPLMLLHRFLIPTHLWKHTTFTHTFSSQKIKWVTINPDMMYYSWAIFIDTFISFGVLVKGLRMLWREGCNS